MNSIAPSLIHKESEIIKRTLRDMYDEDTQNIIIDGITILAKSIFFLLLIKIIMAYTIKI